jgi:hypothetical protein
VFSPGSMRARVCRQDPYGETGLNRRITVDLHAACALQQTNLFRRRKDGLSSPSKRRSRPVPNAVSMLLEPIPSTTSFGRKDDLVREGGYVRGRSAEMWGKVVE